MNDLIDKVALMDALAKRVPYVIDTPDEVAFAQGLKAAYQCVVDAPSVPAEVVRHGRWRYQHDPIKDPKRYFVRIICSVYGLITGQKSSYCPNCGAKMDGQGEGDSNG